MSPGTRLPKRTWMVMRMRITRTPRRRFCSSNDRAQGLSPRRLDTTKATTARMSPRRSRFVVRLAATGERPRPGPPRDGMTRLEAGAQHLVSDAFVREPDVKQGRCRDEADKGNANRENMTVPVSLRDPGWRAAQRGARLRPGGGVATRSLRIGSRLERGRLARGRPGWWIGGCGASFRLEAPSFDVAFKNCPLAGSVVPCTATACRRASRPRRRSGSLSGSRNRSRGSRRSRITDQIQRRHSEARGTRRAAPELRGTRPRSHRGGSPRN